MGVLSEAGMKFEKVDPVEDSIALYRAMIDSWEKVKQGDNSFDQRKRLINLKDKTDKSFASLTRDQQIIACDVLVESGHMHPKTIDLLRIFGGKISQL